MSNIPSGIKELDIGRDLKYIQNHGLGLERFSELEKLHISDVYPDEFGTLLKLPKLKDLAYDIPWGTYSNRTPDLAKLSTLESLEIGGKYRNVGDIASLSNLKNLSINVGGSDITAISNLSNLKTLEIVGDFRGEMVINSLNNLEELSFGVNPRIKDLSMVSNLHNLRKITAINGNYSNDGIVDLLGLGDKSNLTYVNLEGNNVSDVSALANSTNLRFLSLGRSGGKLTSTNFNVISDDLINLEYLDISNTNIDDISFISNMDKLANFEFYRAPIIDYSPIGEHSSFLANNTQASDFSLSQNISVNRPFFKNPFKNIDGSPLKIPDTTDAVKMVNSNGEIDPSGEYILLSDVGVGDKGVINVSSAMFQFPVVDINFNYDIVELDKSKLAKLVKGIDWEDSAIKAKIAKELTKAKEILSSDSIFTTQEQIDGVHKELENALIRAKSESTEKAVERSSIVAPHTGLSSGGMLMLLTTFIVAIVTSIIVWQTAKR